MFQLSHGWGISPSEFWDMTLPEWFVIAAVHYQETKRGNLTLSQIDEIEADNELTDEEWWAKYGTP